MVDLAFDDLVGNPGEVTTTGPPPVNIQEWTVGYFDEWELNRSGYCFLDAQTKSMEVYTVQGFDFQKESINLVRMAKLIEEHGPESLIKVEVSTLFTAQFDAERQVTCKYFGVAKKMSDTAIEPVEFPFEWPNETNVNICTKLSTAAGPVGCRCVNTQYACNKIGYEADTRSLYLYHDKEGKLAVNITLQRYGYGNELLIIHTKSEDNEAWSYFGPVEKDIKTIKDNPSNPEVFDSMTYFDKDYRVIFDKYLASLLDGLFETYGELIKEISPTKEILTEYFSYVKSV